MLDIMDIIRKGEGVSVEFKESKRELNKDVYESVCALLNRIGGYLILGVRDDGSIVGVDKDYVDKIKKNFVTSINNPDKINPTFYTRLEEQEIDGKIVLFAQIPNSSEVHRTAGKIFDRNEDGDINITNNTNLVAQMYNRKINVYTELKIFPYAKIDELNKETFSKVRIMAHNRAGGEHLWERMTDFELLKSTNLYRRDQITGDEGLTLAGILLLGTQEMIFSALPHYKTDAILRINNTDRYDDREVILDNLIESYYKLMNFTSKHLDDKFYLEGSQRINVRNKIFREICANLLIHREFSSAYPAKLIIEKDVVRTENANKPNGFGIIDENDFSPFPKNPAIAKFFREIGLADELGSGVKNVNKYLKIYSGGKPEFIEGDVFKMILPLDDGIECDTTQDKPQDKPQDESAFELLLNYCKIPRSRTEMMRLVGLKDRRNFQRNYLTPMIKKGLVKMTLPDKPTSRNQKYVTVISSDK